jgi:adenylate cyclase
VKHLTLSGFFAIATAAIAAVVAGAMLLLLRQSRQSILAEADKLQGAAATRIEAQVMNELGRASRALQDLEGGILSGAIKVTGLETLEAPLLIRLLADQHLEEITFTAATLRGYDGNGEALLAPHNRFQIAVQRALDNQIITRLVSARGQSGAGATPPSATTAPAQAAQAVPEFVAAVRTHTLAGTFPGHPLVPTGGATDPTEDFTFSVIASKGLRGRLVWSDLHYAESDRELPQAERRIVLTVQKAIFSSNNEFLGVLRCGLLTQELDSIAQMKVDPSSRDRQRVAILATTSRGVLRLVTRVSPTDRVESVDDELRVVSSAPPAELTVLLSSRLAAEVSDGNPRRSGVVAVDGVPWRVTLSKMPPISGGIAGWVVAVLVVEEHYTRTLEDTQRGVLIAFAVTLAVLLLIGGGALLLVRRDLEKIVATTARMRSFDFAAAGDTSVFRDVNNAMEGLERAKTVVRAMGKYVPMDLVRRLYASNAEPKLGGEPTDVSIMFTDIEGFTSMAETLPVSELALRLGAYLEVMTSAIEACEGTIDKYIGDAVMAMWNAPSPVPGHATRACSAVLACIRATDALYASPQWTGLPPLVTRFGVHRARVLVGHFGAPTRLAYTALGDGVNLAARLEPLCKQYGVRTLVSEDVVAEAKKLFRFRRIDRVAVKGKRNGVDIYELVGPIDTVPDHIEILTAYEEAFTAYLERDFDGAIARLAGQLTLDAPSAALDARCRALSAHPPPAQWDGVHIAHSK